MSKLNNLFKKNPKTLVSKELEIITEELRAFAKRERIKDAEKRKGDRLKPGTQSWQDRQRRYAHNSFFGHVGMMKANCRSIGLSSSATPEAKILATEIYDLAIRLGVALKVRVD